MRHESGRRQLKGTMWEGGAEKEGGERDEQETPFENSML